MGNKKSTPSSSEKSPYDILEIEPSATKQEIRTAYLSMLLKYHPQRNKESSDKKVIEIKEAYEMIISGEYKPKYEIDLSKYTEKYFMNLDEGFFDACDNFIRNLLIEEPEASYPSFKSINHTKFYDFFTKFKTKRILSSDKHVNKELQNDFNAKVREIISFMKKKDPRFKTEIKRIEIKKKEKKVRIKKERETEFNCDACKKGFKNVNQFITHISSNKHSEKMGWSEEIRNNEINKLKEQFVPKTEEIKEEINFDDKIEKNTKLLEELYLGSSQKKKNEIINEEIKEVLKEEIKEEVKEQIKKEIKKKIKKKVKKKTESSTQCSICNLVFSSRNKLFIHLNSEHYFKKSKN